MTRHALPLSLLLLGLCACGGKNAPEASAGAPAAPATEASAAPAGSGHASLLDPAPNSQQTRAGSIDFDVPPTWQREPPSSDMRLAQAKIPGPGGLADFAAFFFGPGGGGSVDANVKRWVGQMEGAGEPKPQTFETNGFKVTWVDVKGTMKPSGMGMGPATQIPDARLFGAVVEGPGGPWFFKVQGPNGTLDSQRDAFVAMLKSVRKK